MAATLSAGAASPRVAQAQNDYPNRPVSLIVPYAAGVADVAMRELRNRDTGRRAPKRISRYV
jgi:tripartite-type tricarboxylate transporter receptor subunit TctC